MMPIATTYRSVLGALVCATCLAACADPLPENPGNYQPYQSSELQPLDCVPNLDGKITAREMAPQVGVPERFLVSPVGQTRPVDLMGRPRGNEYVWDWSAQIPSDQLATIEASSLGDKWYADSFPNGQFVAPFDLSGKTDAIYSLTDEALLLHGIASSQENPPEGQTLLIYNQPVELYRFPIAPGHNWVSVGEVQNGTLRGLPYAGRDTYEVNVAATGELDLPSFSFDQVQKVETKVTVEPAAGRSVTTRQVSFLFECFGEVARATSQDGETNDNFSTAAQVRRLGFQ